MAAIHDHIRENLTRAGMLVPEELCPFKAGPDDPVLRLDLAGKVEAARNLRIPWQDPEELFDLDANRKLMLEVWP